MSELINNSKKRRVVETYDFTTAQGQRNGYRQKTTFRTNPLR